MWAGAHLAERLCEHIRRWDCDRTAQPTITVHPGSTPDENLPGNRVVIDKRHVRMVVPAAEPERDVRLMSPFCPTGKVCGPLRMCQGTQL
jgi:hypothetical protein